MRRRLLPFLQLLAVAGVALDCATPETPRQLTEAPKAPDTAAPVLIPGNKPYKPPPPGPPVFIGLDAELGLAGSSSAEAIRNGIQIALEEINAAGGVLYGRPLTLEVRANDMEPRRSIANVQELAAIPDMVAIYCGRSSPTVVEALPIIQQLGIPLLDPWASDDAIVDNGFTPSYVFRLSLRDSWAMPAMIDHARSLGTRRVGMLLPDSDWGRGQLAAAERIIAGDPSFRIVGTQWFGVDDQGVLEKYYALRDARAQAILLVADATQAELLLREVAALRARQRLPIISHWGAAGGRLAQVAGPQLRKVEFSVVQSYSFVDAGDEAARRVIAAHDRLFKTSGARTIESPIGVAHAYDLTHILARAINLAGTTDRKAVRDALERLGPYTGLIRTYVPPFTPERHEALGPEQAFMAEYGQSGALEPIRVPRRRTLED